MKPEPGPPGADAATGPRRSLVGTWSEVFADARSLIGTEAALARLEAAQNLRSFGLEALKLMAGALLLLVALVFLAVAAVVVASWWLGLAGALVLVAAVCVLAGFLLMRGASAAMGSANLVPKQSLARLSRDLERISGNTAPGDQNVGR